MNSDFLPKTAVAFNGLFLAICILFCAALAYNHFQVITAPTPIERNESGMLVITDTIASGGNPYSIDNQPERASGYPVLYNIIVAPVSKIFGNTLPVHRVVAGTFIVAACCLLFGVVRRGGGTRSDSFAAASLLYAGLLFYSTPVAGTNSTGFLLFFLSLFTPWFFSFTNRSLAAALVFGVLAFYGKQYFIACLGYLSLFMFLAVSKKRAVVFGAVSVLVFLSSLVVVNYTSPYFFDNTIFAARYATGFASSYSFLLKQLLDFGLINLPILIVFGALIVVQVVAMFRGESPRVEVANKKRGVINIRDLSAPLLNHKPNYIWYCLFCSLIVIVEIGQNRGNYLTYLFQLLSPFLLAGVFINLPKLGGLKWLAQLLVIVAFYNSYTMLSHDFSVDEKGWAKIKREITPGSKIFGPTVIIPEIMKNGGEVYQNGHTPYAHFAVFKPNFFRKDNPDETVGTVWKNYVNGIYEKIESQEFDLIILDQRTKIPRLTFPFVAEVDGDVLLRKHYRLREKFPLVVAKRPGAGRLRIEIWEPKPQGGQSNRRKPE